MGEKKRHSYDTSLERVRESFLEEVIVGFKITGSQLGKVHLRQGDSRREFRGFRRSMPEHGRSQHR